MNNNEGEHKPLSPIFKAIAWILFLLLAAMVNYMANNSYVCFDEEVCNKPYLNVLP